MTLFTQTQLGNKQRAINESADQIKGKNLIIKLADYYNVSLDYIVGRSEEK